MSPGTCGTVAQHTGLSGPADISGNSWVLLTSHLVHIPYRREIHVDWCWTHALQIPILILLTLHFDIVHLKYWGDNNFGQLLRYFTTVFGLGKRSFENLNPTGNTTTTFDSETGWWLAQKAKSKNGKDHDSNQSRGNSTKTKELLR
mgnify:CR=1 FL=1